MIFSRKAFTMIELIFVIVILGILASIAIPKLAATRDDAQNSKLSSQIKSVANEVIAYTLSSGKVEADATTMSNNLKKMVELGIVVRHGSEYWVKIGGQNDCIIFDINGSQEIVIDIQFTSASGLCEQFQKVSSLNLIKQKIRGQNVTY